MVEVKSPTSSMYASRSPMRIVWPSRSMTYVGSPEARRSSSRIDAKQ
jgi:hypothetical protein